MSSETLPTLAPESNSEAMPLIPRVYEVQMAEDLMTQARADDGAAADLAPPIRGTEAPGHADGAPEPPSPAEPELVTEPLAEGGMPFIGRVVAYAPAESITVQRTLSLAEDLYLADHAFVHAPGVKPISTCMPVLPLTMSLEVLAEVGACLAPGLGLIGFEDVKATRWIELADSESLVLSVTARLHDIDGECQVYRITAAIHLEEQNMPAITATVLFSPAYRVDLEFGFTEFTHPYRLPLTGEGIYQERHMFHGPRFHCLTGDIVVADQGAAAALLVKSPADLFRSVRQPQLLIDPVLLDGIGQFIGVWAMQHDRYVFPIGFRKLELYRPTPPEGTSVPVRIEITRDEAKTLYADVEIQDGAGAVWMRIKEWGNWKFRWPRRLVDFRRQPTRHLLSHTVVLPSLAPTALCRRVSTADIAGFDAKLLARHYLHMDEMAAFAAKAGVPQRQQEWLLGRAAAKDAVRAWLAARTGAEEMLHPAAFVIDHDDAGQPIAGSVDGHRRMPRISLSHCEDRAVAIAGDEALGIDIESIRPRDVSFVSSICTVAERALLDELAGDDSGLRAEWITRLWCAKEAAGKWLGTGVDGAPQRFEAIAIDAGGDIDIQLPGSDRLIGVHSSRDGDFIIACAATDPVAASG